MDKRTIAKEQPKSKRRVDGTRLLEKAIKGDHIDKIKEILESDIYSFNKPSTRELFKYLIVNGKFKIIDLLLEDDRFVGNILEIACDTKDAKVLRSLLEHYTFDPEEKSIVLIYAAGMEAYGDNEDEKEEEYSKITELCKVLLEDPEVDPAFDPNFGDPDADPSLGDNEAIAMASRSGNLKLVELLLKYPNVNPSAQKGKALELAIAKSHPDIVEVLLEDPRTNGMIGGLSALQYWIRYPKKENEANVEILKILIHSPKFNLTEDDNSLIKNISASLKHNIEKMEFYRKKADEYTDVMAILLNDQDIHDTLSEKKLEKYSNMIGG